MNKNIFIVILSFTLVLAFSSCSTKVDTTGLTEGIHNIVPDTILTEMINMGMPINGGDNPPELIGTYNVSPFILDTSNIATDTSGKVFADFVVTFHDFNKRKLTVKIDYVNGPETGTGIGSFIVGKDNTFSVFCEIKATQLVIFKSEVVMVFTGTLKDDGIENFIYANFMVDNHGDDTGIWINNGEGRIIYDTDGFSERTDISKSTQKDLNMSSALSK